MANSLAELSTPTRWRLMPVTRPDLKRIGMAPSRFDPAALSPNMFIPSTNGETLDPEKHGAAHLPVLWIFRLPQNGKFARVFVAEILLYILYRVESGRWRFAVIDCVVHFSYSILA